MMKSQILAAVCLALPSTLVYPEEPQGSVDAVSLEIGFESAPWKGIELSTTQVKTGKHSGLWKDHVLNKSVSIDNIPHDWSGFDEMRLWIFNEKGGRVPMMVVLLSRTDPKNFSYFGYRVTVDWKGWKEVVLPFSKFESAHSPAGWNQIDSIMLSVDGWGMKPDPEAVLYLDGLSVRKAVVKTASIGQKAAMDLIKKQFCDFQREAWKMSGGAGQDEESVSGWIRSLTAEGAWPDINYADQTRGYWRTMNHLNRINRMCMVYTSPESKLRGDPALSKAIHAALAHWLKNDYQNPNWWHKEIGVPRELSTIMLLLDAELSPQERAGGIRLISRSVIDSPAGGGRGALTGQNRVWVAANALTHGLLVSDYELVELARRVIFEEVLVSTQEGGQDFQMVRKGAGDVQPSTQEGIQPDYSFFQHGSMLQLGNYGLAFAGDIVMWATVLRGTGLALDPDKLGIIRDYLLQGESPVVWKGAMDISSCGRQIGARSPAGKGAAVLRILASAVAADSAHAADYRAAMEQISPDAPVTAIPPKNKFFWRADYMVHRRPDFYISTRMSSCRVLASELVNGENLQGGYSGDGATYVYRTGREYEDIFPVWDWSRLPGVTSPRITDKELLKPVNWKTTNASDFVGGVSDGIFGASVFKVDRDGLTASKSWFYFDDKIVCLGAGIADAKSGLPVNTSVNQCLANGDISMDVGRGATKAAAGLQDTSTLKWAWHDNVGYIFPEAQQITIGSQDQTGAWNEINASASPAALSRNVFSIWINHGANPRGAGYSYLILPGISPEALAKQAAEPDITILKNTSALQAVRDARLGVTQAVFCEPGALAYGGEKSIAVDKPCILMLDEKRKRISIADPTQKLSEITVTWNGEVDTIALPSGASAGASVSKPK